MARSLQEALEFIRGFRCRNPDASKDEVAEATARECGLIKSRKVFGCADYALRFSSAAGMTFSNTILGLRQLRKVDHVPFVVVVCRPASTEFLLANTTMLKKISHSSHQLRIDNIRGSFLGHDIAREYDGIPNTPENLDRLFACHQEFTWDENLQRLVEATNAIAGTGRRFEPTATQRETILSAPALAADLSSRESYGTLKRELAAIVSEQSRKILEIARAHPTNVNLRGNLIEQVITEGINEHNLSDMIRRLDDEITLEIEVKSKLMDRSSAPKAYNVDKALQTLARPSTLIVFCLVGIDVGRDAATVSTVSVLDETVLQATRVQFHWAGRNSRGVTQLTGDLSPLFHPDYRERVNVELATSFLTDLLDH